MLTPNANRASRAQAHPRSRWLLSGALVLLVLIALGAFLLGRVTMPRPAGVQPLPTYIHLPPDARLAWYDTYLDPPVVDWTYVVAGATNDSVAAYYLAQLPRDGWQCVRETTSTNITREGKAYTGASNYITALRGTLKAQIYTADQGYGSFLLQDDLPAHAIALRISLLTETNLHCV